MCWRWTRLNKAASVLLASTCGMLCIWLRRKRFGHSVTNTCWWTFPPMMHDEFRYFRLCQPGTRGDFSPRETGSQKRFLGVFMPGIRLGGWGLSSIPENFSRRAATPALVLTFGFKCHFENGLVPTLGEIRDDSCRFVGGVCAACGAIYVVQICTNEGPSCGKDGPIISKNSWDLLDCCGILLPWCHGCHGW